MVIREFHPFYQLVFIREVVDKRSVFGDAGEENQPFGINESLVGFFVDLFHRAIADMGEKESPLAALVVLSLASRGAIAAETKVFSPFALFPLVEIRRALCYNHYVCLTDTFRKISQLTEGKKLVFMDGAVVVDQDDIDVGFEFPILKGIVENYYVAFRDILIGAFTSLFGCLKIFGIAKEMAPFDSILVNCYCHGRELFCYLEGFIPECRRRPVP